MIRRWGRIGRAWCRAAVVAAALVGPGCSVETESDPGSPPPTRQRAPRLIPVKGRVTLDGKPLAGAIVVFLPSLSEGTHGTGETNAAGEFELATILGPGTAAGNYNVAVSLIVSPEGKPVGEAQRTSIAVPPELLRGRELIPPRYNDLSKTELHATVRSIGTQSFEFDLKGPLLDPPRPSPTGALPSLP